MATDRARSPYRPPMCRLLGMVARTPTDLDTQLAQELPLFVGLSTSTATAGASAIGRPTAGSRSARSRSGPRTARSSRAAVAGTASDVALLHIRQASPGMPLTVANTHPFLADGLAFAHNGYAWPTATLDDLIAERGAPLPVGDTDSERYLLARAGGPARAGRARTPCATPRAHHRSRHR